MGVAALLFTAEQAYAQAVDPLVVQFVPDPLFEQSNFLPGDDSNGEISVTNNSETAQDVIIETVNVFDD